MGFGGISINEVITFQTQIMMGNQFGRVKNAQNKDDIMIACLRMGWSDAFRHISENVIAEGEKESNLDIKEKEWRKVRDNNKKTHTAVYDDFICGEILSKKVLLETFKNYSKAENSEAKVKTVCNNFDELKELFKEFKRIDGDKKLSFGHFQKMFNIAIKLYVCLYMCADYLKLSVEYFDKDILNNIVNADCPVDSIILERLSKDTGDESFKNHKWGKFSEKDRDYINVQTAIESLENIKGKSKLYYDFIAWKQ